MNRRLGLESTGARITGDAGLPAVRELDEMMGLTGVAGDLIVEGYKEMDKKLYPKADAAQRSPDTCEYLEDNSILHAIRLKANANLYREIDHLMTRPVGRPSRKPKASFHDFSQEGASWR